MNTKLVIFVAFVCVVLGLSSALECNSGSAPYEKEGAPLRKNKYSDSVYKCCYKYAEANGAKTAMFGAVPPNLAKKACGQVGKCFYDKYVTHKNVCICADAEDKNCQSGPIKLSDSALEGGSQSSSVAPAVSTATAITSTSTSSSPSRLALKSNRRQ
uniref:Uncharacterized protein n=1 Tax=Plectus sambesii TaxID=2011161 RepID=A0A914XDW8_9BILA